MMSNSAVIPQQSDRPTISVVMPVFNGAETMGDALDSIFRQTILPDEVIVVDDGSQDNTLEIAAGYGNRIIVLNQENKGNANARNLGCQRATGEFIAVLDADDLWLSDKLEKQIELCANSDVIYTGVHNFGDSEHVDSDTFQNGTCVAGDHLCPLMLDNFIAHSSVLMRRESFISAGGYDSTFRTTTDWDLWLRMAQLHMTFCGIPESKTLYRWSAGSTSKDHSQTCKDRLRAITNAIERSDPQRVSSEIRKQALRNVWRTSAWFASKDQPKNAINWYWKALRIEPTSTRTWIDLIRTTLNSIRAIV